VAAPRWRFSFKLLHWQTYACLALGGLLTLVSVRIASMENDRIVQEAVQHRADQMLEELRDRFGNFQYGLRGMRGIVVTADEHDLSRERVRLYSLSRAQEQEFPGALGFGIIFRVSDAELPAFLEESRKDGATQFKERELAPHEGDHFIIRYVEPEGRNKAAIGLDIASEPNRREAALRAMRSGEVSLTAPIKLVQSGKQLADGFLILLPMYDGAATPPTEALRLEKCEGWTYAPLIADLVFKDLAVSHLSMAVSVDDVTVAAHPQRFYQRKPGSSPLLHGQGLVREHAFYGRTWRTEVTPSVDFIASLPLYPIWLFWLLGSGAVVLATALTQSRFNAQARRRELASSNALRAAIVESSQDAIVSVDPHGLILGWNRRATEMFGLEPESVLGLPITEVIVPKLYWEEDRTLMRAALQGETVAIKDTVRQSPAGQRVPVDVVAAPIHDESGRIVGVAKTLHDVTERQDWETQLLAANRSLELQVAERTGELAQAREALQTVLDGVPNMIGYWDRNQVNVVANRAYEEAYGVPAGMMPGMTAKEVLGEEIYTVASPHIAAVLRGEPQHFRRVQTLRADRGPQYMMVDYLPRTVGGEVEGFYSIVTDITELELSRRELLRSMGENRALLEAIDRQFLFAITSHDGTIETVNQNFCAASGYAREELIGQRLDQLSKGSHDHHFWLDVWQQVERGDAWQGEINETALGGELRCYETVIARLDGAAGGSMQRNVVLRSDVTLRKQHEQQIAGLNRFLTKLLDSALNVAIIATDTAGCITLFNLGAEQMLGYRAAEVVGRTQLTDLHLGSELKARAEELNTDFGTTVTGFDALTYVALHDGAETRHWQLCRRSGKLLTASVSLTPTRDDDGSVTGFLGIAIDVSEQEAQRQEIHAVSEQLGLATQVARLGIWSWFPGNDEVRWNHRMFEIYGRDGAQQNGATPTVEAWQRQVHPEDLGPLLEAFSLAMANQSAFDHTFRIITPEGEVRYIESAAYLQRDALGEVESATGINRDITGEQTLEQALRRAKQQAEEASAAKSAFLANVSHELRTPMNAVLGMLQLLARTPLDGVQRDYATKAQIAAGTLLQLLNDVLDFSKIEASKMEIEQVAYSLPELLDEVAVLISGIPYDKPVEVVFSLAPNLPATLVGDHLRLKQVLINLASNAIKFTERGVVRLVVAGMQDLEGRAWVKFAVRDTGIGISPAQQRRIFDSFVQAEDSTSRRFGGTGLGLSISRRLVEMMGGTLQLTSQLGEGSEFSFMLPDSLHEATDGVSAQDLAGEPAVWLAMGSESLADQLETDIGLAGGKVRRFPDAPSLQAAWQVLQARELEAPPLTVIVDWAGQTGKGDVLADWLAERGQATLVLAKAGERSSFGGSLRVLTRPLTRFQLLHALLHQEAGWAETSQPVAVGSRQLEGMQILVVEDNALNRQVAFELLKQAGAVVTLAEGGHEGVRQVLEAGPFDLVLMDMQMPDLDGLSATRQIRADSRFDALPILAMTANASTADREACLQAGMNDHIGKPFDIEQLQLTIRRHVLSAGDSASVPVLSNAAGPEAVETTTIESLDAVIRRFGGDRELYAEVLAGFKAEALPLLESLQAAASAGDWAGAKTAMHTLRGVALTVGAKALSEHAAAMERELKHNKEADWPKMLETDVPMLAELLETSCSLLGAKLAEYGLQGLTTG